MTTLFVIGTLLLQVLVPYHRYVSYLKWLTLLGAFTASPPIIIIGWIGAAIMGAAAVWMIISA